MPTDSLWKSITTPGRKYFQLNEDIEVDIAIVGGGITGITAAYELVKAGKKVAILEAGKIGGVTTSSSTGNLYIPVQPYFQNILSKFDKEIVKAIIQSRKSAIDYIENITQIENIHCNFTRRPWFLYTADSDKVSFLKKEIEILNKCGIAADCTNNIPLPFTFKKAAVLEQQARFNPLQYVISLAQYLHESGCLIYEDTRVISHEEKEVCIFKTENHKKIVARHSIIATHTPIGINPLQFFTAPYRSYAIGVHLKDNFYPEGHFWDLDHPHHATCTHALLASHPEILVVAGNHHKTGQDSHSDSRFKELESFLQKYFDISEIAYRWSAQHYHSADNIPYIGLSAHAKYTYLATGFFSDGLIYGTMGALIIANLILQKNNDAKNFYKPNRFKPIASFPFLLKENINVFTQYMKDYPFRTTEIALKSGESKIIEKNGEKCAVYKDEHNKVHSISAVCTHMKCIVGWNNAEKTWDCPCHGSRFTIDGKVIEGPALYDLEKK